MNFSFTAGALMDLLWYGFPWHVQQIYRECRRQSHIAYSSNSLPVTCDRTGALVPIGPPYSNVRGHSCLMLLGCSGLFFTNRITGLMNRMAVDGLQTIARNPTSLGPQSEAVFGLYGQHAFQHPFRFEYVLKCSKPLG